MPWTFHRTKIVITPTQAFIKKRVAASTGRFAGMGSLGRRVDRTCHSAVTSAACNLVVPLARGQPDALQSSRGFTGLTNQTNFHSEEGRDKAEAYHARDAKRCQGGC